MFLTTVIVNTAGETIAILLCRTTIENLKSAKS